MPDTSIGSIKIQSQADSSTLLKVNADGSLPVEQVTAVGAGHLYPGTDVTLVAGVATLICTARTARRSIILRVDPNGAFPGVAVRIGHDNTIAANKGLALYGDFPAGDVKEIATNDAVWGFSASAVPVSFVEVSD